MCKICENYKTLMNKIKEKLNKSSTHGFEVSILLRCQVSPNWTVNSVQYQSSPAGFWGVEIGKLILKFIWKGKLNRIAITILKKKDQTKAFTLPYFKTYC